MLEKIIGKIDDMCDKYHESKAQSLVAGANKVVSDYLQSVGINNDGDYGYPNIFVDKMDSKELGLTDKLGALDNHEFKAKLRYSADLVMPIRAAMDYIMEVQGKTRTRFPVEVKHEIISNIETALRHYARTLPTFLSTYKAVVDFHATGNMKKPEIAP